MKISIYFFFNLEKKMFLQNLFNWCHITKDIKNIKTKLKSKKTWKIQKKSKLNSEKI
jgi:hypothetical protein